MTSAPDPGVNYGGSIRQMPAWAESMLMSYLAEAGLDRVWVNSTMRTPEEQASAMYDNEMNGKHIEYATPGAKVLSMVQVMYGADRSSVVAAMAGLIRDFTSKGVVVSYHCDGPEGFTAADLEPTSVGGVGSGSYNALMGALRSAKNRGELKELLSPDVGKGNRGYDPAIHVVLVQGSVAQAEAALENAVTGGDAAAYEGDDAPPGGIPTWAWLLGGVGAVWYFLKRRK